MIFGLGGTNQIGLQVAFAQDAKWTCASMKLTILVGHGKHLECVEIVVAEICEKQTVAAAIFCTSALQRGAIAIHARQLRTRVHSIEKRNILDSPQRSRV